MIVLQAFARGALVFGAAGLLTFALGRRSAAIRHHVWASAVIIQLAILAFIPVLPPLTLPVMPRITAFTVAEPIADAGAPALQLSERNAGVSGQVELTTSTQPTVRPFSWRDILLSVYLAGAALIFLRYLTGTLLMARLAHRARRVEDGEWLALNQRIAADLGITRPVTLVWGDKLAVPITWGILYPMILLPQSAQEWTLERRRFVLVHEMAHIKRYDAVTQLIAQIALAVFWFSPLVWLAEWRLRVEREHACDDVVLHHGTAATLYADELLQMVRALVSRRATQPAFAALAMARKSEFEGRMLAILDPARVRGAAGIGSTIAFIVLSLAIAAPLAALDPFAVTVTTAERLPARQTAARSAGPKHVAAALHTNAPALEKCKSNTTLTSVHADVDDHNPSDNRIDILLQDENRCVTAAIHGDVLFSNDDATVREMGRNASVYLSEQRPGLTYEARVMPGDNGAPVTSFWVDGKATAGNSRSEAWLARTLVEVLRESGEHASERVAVLLKAHGLRGTLETISAIRSPAARTRHFVALIESNTWSRNELDQIGRAAALALKDAPSDLNRILRALPPAQGAASNDLLEQIFSGITSDADLRQALVAEIPGADKATLLMLARTSLRLESSFEKRTFLVSAVSFMLARHDAEMEDAWFKSANTISSSYERKNALMSAMWYAYGNPRVRDMIAKSTQTISSELERAAVLRSLAGVR